MKSILFIVTESRSANGICTHTVMKEFVRNGYAVYCITNHEYGGKREYEKDGVLYYAVKPRLCYQITSVLENHKDLSKGKKVFLQKLHILLSKSKLILTHPMWPLISPLYADRIYRKAKRICKNADIDVIIPVYTQIDTLIAAKRVKGKNHGIRYIPYFLDSLSGGYGPKVFSQAWTIKRGIYWERKLLPAADSIIMMRSSREHYEKYCLAEEYYPKIHFLDIPLFCPQIQSGRCMPNCGDKDTVEMLFVGTIPEHIRPPQYFMDLFSKLKGENFRFTIIGSSTCEEYFQDVARKDPRIKRIPFVEHEVALNAMASADILINLGNNNVHMTPSKIFEYMSFGKPIISTAPISNEPSIRYLEQYPNSCVVDYSLPIEQNVEKVTAFIRNSRDKVVLPEEIAERFYLNTPKAFFDFIEKREKTYDNC